jgi:hypothetical protein
MNLGEYIEDFLVHPEKYHYRIIWYINVLRVGKRKFSLGYCTYGKGIAFITNDPLTVMLVDQVSVRPPLDDGAPGSCSDGKWCLNRKCPFSSGKNKLRVNVEEIERKLKEAGYYDFEMYACGNVVFNKPVIGLRRQK